MLTLRLLRLQQLEAVVGVKVGIESDGEEEAESRDRGTIEIGVDRPLNFKGTEGVVGLTRWFEKMETVFHISNCPQEYQVKTDAAYAITWKELMKLMIEVFQELVLLCTKLVPEEEDQVEKFIGGLPGNIQGNVIVVEPMKLQGAVHIANNLLDQKLKGYAARNAENKRRFDNNSRDNRVQQPPFKRQNGNGQNMARAYTVGYSEKRGYAGPLPYCNKCKLHHEGQCTVKCGNCNTPIFRLRSGNYNGCY
ncbi:hypothetical protein Tco_0602216 [Tanacetum coccineum]